MNDIKISWREVVKGDLIVVNGRWWKVKSIKFFYHTGKVIENSTDFPSRCEVEVLSIEENTVAHWPIDPCEQIRVRPTGRDPWEGRRKEGRE